MSVCLCVQSLCPLAGLADVFSLEEASHRQVLEAFLDAHLGWHRGDVVRVDGRGLYDPNGTTNHPGVRPGVLEGVVYHGKLEQIMFDCLSMLGDVLWSSETGEPSKGGVCAYLTPFCKKGRHRSMSLTVLLRRWLETQGAQVTSEHLCKPNWTGCKGRCDICRGHKDGEGPESPSRMGFGSFSGCGPKSVQKHCELLPPLSQNHD